MLSFHFSFWETVYCGKRWRSNESQLALYRRDSHTSISPHPPLISLPSRLFIYFPFSYLLLWYRYGWYGIQLLTINKVDLALVVTSFPSELFGKVEKLFSISYFPLKKTRKTFPSPFPFPPPPPHKTVDAAEMEKFLRDTESDLCTIIERTKAFFFVSFRSPPHGGADPRQAQIRPCGGGALSDLQVEGVQAARQHNLVQEQPTGGEEQGHGEWVVAAVVAVAAAAAVAVAIGDFLYVVVGGGGGGGGGGAGYIAVAAAAAAAAAAAGGGGDIEVLSYGPSSFFPDPSLSRPRPHGRVRVPLHPSPLGRQDEDHVQGRELAHARIRHRRLNAPHSHL